MKKCKRSHKTNDLTAKTIRDADKGKGVHEVKQEVVWVVQHQKGFGKWRNHFLLFDKKITALEQIKGMKRFDKMFKVLGVKYRVRKAVLV